MNNSTFIQVPSDVTNPVELSRFLHRLIEILDTAYGNRGDTPLAELKDVVSQATTLAGLKADVNSLDKRYVKLDGSNDIEALLKYANDTTLDNGKALLSMNLLRTQTTTPTISSLTSTDSGVIKDKINEIIQILNMAQLINR